MSRGTRSLLLDAALVGTAASVRVVVERLRGLEHAAADLGTLFIPNFAWWWSAPRWLGGWNSWIFAGYPANGDPQSGQLHPFGLLYASLQPLTAAAVDGALTPAVAAIGMLLYIRQLGCGRAASLVGALSFGLGGFVAAQAVHPAQQRAAIAVPWALAAIEGLDGAALVAGLGAATAAIVLSGHPQMMAYALAIVVLYAGWLGRPAAPRRAAALAAGLVLGAGVGAAVWLPALELLQQSVHAFGVADMAAPPAAAPGPDRLVGIHLAGLVVPFAGGGSAGPLYGRSHESLSCSVTECAGYPGMLVWILLLAGLPALLRDPRGRFWLATGAAGLVLATGIAGVQPAVHAVRAPARFVLWWNLAAASAGGLALGRLLETRERSTLARLAAAVLALAAFVAWTATRGPLARRAAVGAGAVLAGSAPLALAIRASPASLVGALALDLLAFGLSIPVGVPSAALHSSTGALRLIREVRQASATVADGLGRSLVLPFIGGANWAPFEGTRLLQGYNPLVLRSLATLLGYRPSLRVVEIGWVMDTTLVTPSSHVLDLLRCTTVVSLPWAHDRVSAALEAAVRSGGTRWSRLADGGPPAPQLYVNQRALPVAWLVRRTRVVSPPEAIRLVRGEDGGFDPAVEALVEHAVADLVPPAAGAAAGPPVAVSHYGDDTLRLAADSPAHALLVTSELAYPGWTASVDGRPADLLTVNAGFRAVVVPAGRHEVIFAYRPRSARIGLTVSALAALALAGCVVRAGRAPVGSAAASGPRSPPARAPAC